MQQYEMKLYEMRRSLSQKNPDLDINLQLWKMNMCTAILYCLRLKRTTLK